MRKSDILNSDELNYSETWRRRTCIKWSSSWFRSKLRIFLSVLIYFFWFWQRRIRCLVISGSGPQLYIGFTVTKFCRNLCSLGWLTFSFNRVSHLVPLLAWTSIMEFSGLASNLSNTFKLYCWRYNEFMASLKLLHSWEQCGKMCY